MAFDPDITALADQLTSAGSSYGSLTPGSLPAGDYSGSQYYPGGGSWWDRNFGMNSGAGPSNADLSKALGGWGKQASGAASQGDSGGGQGGAPVSNSPTGNPRRPVNLDALVQKLLQQQQSYYGSNQPAPASRVLGLLGF